MTCEEILRRVEEIEAELGDGSTDDYPAPETITEGEVRWLCRAVRQLVAQLEQVEAENAAMREALEQVIKVGVGQTEASFSHMTSEDCSYCEEKDEIVEAALAENDAGRALLERLRRLEAVAEAAREIAECEPYYRDYALSGNSDPRVCYYCGAPWEHKAPQHKPGCPLEKLRRTLAALEEEKDGDL